MEEREAGDWNETEGEGKTSRQMLNGACKYRERRDTKGAPKRSGVRAGWQKGNGKGRGRGGDVRGRFIVCRARRIARVVYPPGKGEPEKGRRGVAGQQHKGLF